nr:hypothetical protein [Ruegeria arenilitoris]
MGRLTLNVLLSFVQYEREVTAERIRDKIAASKKRGLWMGGLPPLGYDPHSDPKTQGLTLNAKEADTVRAISTLYAKLGCLNAVMRRTNEMGLSSKLHHFKSSRVQGGTPFSRAARSTRCFETRSTLARSATRRKSRTGSMTPLSTT